MQFEIPDYDSIILNPKRNDCALIIPVINEGERIRKQINQIYEFKPLADVVIVDGGSIDGSLDQLDYFQERNVHAILIKRGPGKLSAQLRLAFSFVINSNYLYAITMDGNNKDGIDGISGIKEALEAGFDFVQGSRFITGGKAINTPLYRTIAIKCIHAPITSCAAGTKFTDSTNGFRGFSARLLMNSEIAIFRNIFSKYELLFYLPIRASRLKFKVKEVPVSRMYPSHGKVPTKIKGIKSYLNILSTLLLASLGYYNPRQKRRP